MIPKLNIELATESLQAFFRDKPLVFFGTGMSCALDPNFGMSALKDHLIAKIVPETLVEPQRSQWESVLSSLSGGKDLESAMNSVSDPTLTSLVVSTTGNFIASLDSKHAYNIANGKETWDAITFFKKMVDTLPESDPILHVLTPNYDMLFEYSCDRLGIPYTNGFSGGIERVIEWIAAERSMQVMSKVARNGRQVSISKYRKHIRLYKVHGSLNYFHHKGSVVENNLWTWNPPSFAPRVIVTPGISKYETLQHYRRELLRVADDAIDKANRFLFLGYGFNDSHLEEYIKRKLIDQECNGLIITRDSNPRIEGMLKAAHNLWLVCKDSSGTRISNAHYSDLVLPGVNLWNVVDFATNILGA